MEIVDDLNAIIAKIDALEEQNSETLYTRQNLVWCVDAMDKYYTDPSPPMAISETDTSPPQAKQPIAEEEE